MTFVSFTVRYRNKTIIIIIIIIIDPITPQTLNFSFLFFASFHALFTQSNCLGIKSVLTSSSSHGYMNLLHPTLSP